MKLFNLPVDILTEPNKLYGFAVYHMLSIATGFSHVSNQPQNTNYDSSKPQLIIGQLGKYVVPAVDMQEYEFEVTLDPTKEFWSQTAVLKKAELSEFETSKVVYVNVSCYRLTLCTLMEVLPRLERYGAEILPCLESAGYEEYGFTKEESAPSP